jgi:hypothetical protein
VVQSEGVTCLHALCRNREGTRSPAALNTWTVPAAQQLSRAGAEAQFVREQHRCEAVSHVSAGPLLAVARECYTWMAPTCTHMAGITLLAIAIGGDECLQIRVVADSRHDSGSKEVTNGRW